MGVLGKIKNFFVEEVEEDEEDEEEVREQQEPEEEQLARKVEVPKKSFRERFKLREKLEEEEEEDEEEPEQKIELEQQEPNVYIPKNNNIEFEEEEITPPEKKEETTFEEVEEEVLPPRNTRVPLVFEDDNLFQDEEDYAPAQEEEEIPEEEEVPEEKEPTPPPREKYKPPLLYQGRKESNYIDSIKKETYNKPKREENNIDGKKFRPSPIISPIYGILDKNYKKEEIRTVSDKSFNGDKKEKAIDNIRKKAYGEEKRENSKNEVATKTEKKVNINRETPTVSKVTIADADEYYNDLGLAYNVDYKDMSRSQTKKKAEPKEKDDDNLFDLIDSMYNKKED